MSFCYGPVCTVDEKHEINITQFLHRMFTYIKQKSTFTSLTAPEFEVHIALVLARPTVEPSKSTPLNEEEGKFDLDASSNGSTHHPGNVLFSGESKTAVSHVMNCALSCLVLGSRFR